MRIIIKILIGFALMLPSCNEEPPLPKAVFNFSLNGGCTTDVLEVVFENLSLYASTYLWDFGDDTTSEEINPKKVYAKAGVYPVKLTVINSGNTSMQISDVGVYRNSDGEGPSAEFTVIITNPQSHMYNFIIDNYDISANYYLDFGDGTVIMPTSELIKHQYPGPGRFIVRLDASNLSGRNCYEVAVTP